MPLWKFRKSFHKLQTSWTILWHHFQNWANRVGHVVWDKLLCVSMFSGTLWNYSGRFGLGHLTKPCCVTSSLVARTAAQPIRRPQAGAKGRMSDLLFSSQAYADRVMKRWMKCHQLKPFHHTSQPRSHVICKFRQQKRSKDRVKRPSPERTSS